MANKKDFKVVESGKETPKTDFTELTDKASLEKLKGELQAQGIKIQNFVNAEGKDLVYGERRLYAELFNVYASGVDCLTALLSVKK